MDMRNIGHFIALGVLTASAGCTGIVRINKVPPNEPLDAHAAIERYFGDRRLDQIEGVWVWDDAIYEVAIVRDENKLKGYDYLGILVDAKQGTWRPGEIKFALRSTAITGAFSCLYWSGNGEEYRTTLMQTGENLLSISLPLGMYGSQVTSLLLRTHPKDPTPHKPEHTTSSGTAFWVSSNTLATNEHVIRDAQEITIVCDGQAIPAEPLARDVRNDLALLRILDQPQASTMAYAQRKTPLQLGERVFVIGFPLSTILGASPTVAEGIVSKITGIEDDPREFQISAPIQSGSSGSPVFDANGALVGVLSSTLNSSAVIRSGASAPQNVNFAIRSSYLLNLMEATNVALDSGTLQQVGSPADFAQKLGKVAVQVKAVR